MPSGRPKKAQESKSSEEQDVPSSQVGQKQREPSGDSTQSIPSVVPSAVPSASTNEFTSSLIVALKDPGVIAGFEAMFSSMMDKKIEDKTLQLVQPLQDKVDDVENTLSLISESVSANKDSTDSAVDKLSTRIRELERQSRGRNLRITGLNPCPGNDIHVGYVTSIMKILVEAGIEGLSGQDFVEFSRINSPKSNGSNFSVLVKLSTESKRNLLYSQKGKLKKCTSKHFVNEDLTKFDLKIFHRTRNEVKQGDLFACWTRNGQVWAKSTENGKPFVVSE